jgi:hypothetical protein
LIALSNTARLTPAMTARGMQLAKTVLAAVLSRLQHGRWVVGAAAGDRAALRQAMSLTIDLTSSCACQRPRHRGAVAGAADIFGYDPAYRNPTASSTCRAPPRCCAAPDMRTASTRPPVARCISPWTSTTPARARS